jgi:DNA-binding MarR family transcriptional regulator
MRIGYNKDTTAAMLKQNEKKNEYEEQQQQQQQQQQHDEERVEELSKREIQILNCIKGQSRTEKKIAKMIKLDIFIVSPLITELMLKGYVEIIRRRRLFFFSREYFIITAEGLVALEQARSLFENIVELIKERAVETIDNIAADSPLLKLTVMSAKAAYKTVKVLV